MQFYALVECQQHQAPTAILNCDLARRSLMNYYGGSDDSFRAFDNAVLPTLLPDAQRRFKGCPARHELEDDAVQTCLLEVLRTRESAAA